MQRVDEDQDGLAKYATPHQRQQKKIQRSQDAGKGTSVRGLCSSSAPTTKHSFLGKYGVGKITGSQGTSDTASYWFRRLGLLETLEPTKKSVHTGSQGGYSGGSGGKPVHPVARGTFGEAPGAASTSSMYTSLRTASAAMGNQRRSRRRAGVVPGGSIGGVVSPQSGRGSTSSRGRVICEDAEAMLMRQVLMEGVCCARPPRSDCEGSSHSGISAWSSVAAGGGGGGSKPGSIACRSVQGGCDASQCASEMGDSWSVASSYSSYSLLAGSEAGDEQAKAGAGPAAGGEYKKVLLMSDDEYSMC